VYGPPTLIARHYFVRHQCRKQTGQRDCVLIPLSSIGLYARADKLPHYWLFKYLTLCTKIKTEMTLTDHRFHLPFIVLFRLTFSEERLRKERKTSFKREKGATKIIEDEVYAAAGSRGESQRPRS